MTYLPYWYHITTCNIFFDQGIAKYAYGINEHYSLPYHIACSFSMGVILPPQEAKSGCMGQKVLDITMISEKYLRSFLGGKEIMKKREMGEMFSFFF